jgi:uncharacterized integral membrane protein
MLRKIVTAIVVVPLVVIIVAFAVANRQAVTVSFDPLSTAAPAYAVTLPLFIILFVILILGVLVGGFAAWLRQGKWRRAARQVDNELRSLHREHDALRRRMDAAERPTQGEPSAPLGIPPPVA